jgi:hypothetical protein
MPSRSFHDSNIKRESGLADDASRLRDDLTTAIKARIEPASWTVAGTHVRLAKASVQVQRIKHIDGGRLLVELTATYSGSGKRTGDVAGRLVQWVRLITEGRMGVREPGRAPLLGYPVAYSDPDGNPASPPLPTPPLEVVFPLPAGAFQPSGGGAGALLVPARVFERLARFFNAAEGDPTYASGLWMRMAYFSAVTVTTLGFGDVTPVSSGARIAIALEAILGIIFVGLFLNALAYRARST